MGVALILVGSLIFVACTSGQSGATKAPDFQITLYGGQDAIGGDVFRLSDFRGRPVLVNFWGALCPPCRAEMPSLQRLFEEHRDEGFIIVGVDVGEVTGLGSQEEGREFLKEIGVTYPTGPGSAQVFRDYEVLGMPTSVFIKPDGTVHREWTGFIPEKSLVALVEEIS